MKLTVKPYEYQMKGIEFCKEHKWVMIADEMGLGKTLQAIGVISELEGDIVIVCPASLMNTWFNEICKFAPRLSKDVKLARKGKSRISIYSYAEFNNKSSSISTVTAVIFDEAHYLKNKSAGRSQAAMAFAKKHKPEYLLMLTGTPIPNSAVDIYFPMCILNVGSTSGMDIKYMYPTLNTFGDYFAYKKITYFKSKYGSKGYDTKYEGFRRERKPKLQALLKGKYIRRLAKNELELPPITIKDIDLGFSEDLKQLEAVEEAIAEGHVKTPHLMKLKADMAYLTVPPTVSYVKEMHEVSKGDPVIIYTDHINSIQALHIELMKIGKVKRIEGHTSIKNRQLIVDSFQKGEIDFLLCTIGAAAEGLTLTRARNLVFNDLPWTPKDYEQVIKRIHRIGQNNKCVIHRMLYSKSSLRMANMLDKKTQAIKSALE